MMVVALALGGCGSHSTGVVEAGNGLLSLTVSGPSLAAATERGLHDAAAHCAGQGRQTQILGTQMGRDDYQLAFRCTGRTAAPRTTPAPVAATPVMVPLQPDAAPVLNGEGFGRPAAPPPPTALPQPARVAPGMVLLQPANAPVLSGEGFAGGADPPVQATPAAVPAVAGFPSAVLPPVAGTMPLSAPPGRLLALPPLLGPAGLRRD